MIFDFNEVMVEINKLGQHRMNCSDPKLKACKSICKAAGWG